MAHNTIAHNTFVTKTYPLIRRLSEDTAQLICSQKESFTKLGGLPVAPKGFSWPHNGDIPLDFIGQVKLSEVNQGALKGIFPTKGLMYFFFRADLGKQDFWFGHRIEDKNFWRVLFLEDEECEILEHQSPSIQSGGTIYKQKFLESVDIRIFPHEDQLLKHGIGIHKSDSIFYEVFRDSQYHGYQFFNQFGGFPYEIQNGFMDIDCAFSSRGIDPFDESEENKIRVNKVYDELTLGDEYILLFQVDSDDYGNMNWGDGGRLYFWITRNDLIFRNFDKVWMILQCH